MKRIILLGASGSIGKQSIDVIREHPSELSLVGAGVGKNVSYLEELLESFDLYIINIKKIRKFHTFKKRLIH